jgi:hypothetical protein
MAEWHDFQKLESALIETGRAIEYPPTPPLAAHVRGALQADRARRPVRSIFKSRGFAIGLAVIAVVLALLLIPQTREVIAQILGLRTIRIIEATPTPTAPVATAAPTVIPAPTPTPGVVPFKQCCPSSLADAQQRARFKILLPPDEAPSQVFFQDQIFGRGSDAQQLVLVFGNANQPRFILYEAQGWLYEKIINVSGATAGTTITETQVNGQRALWLTGAPHILVTLDQAGNPLFDTERPVNANTLVWEKRDSATDTTYRLETALSLAEAVRFAEALR